LVYHKGDDPISQLEKTFTVGALSFMLLIGLVAVIQPVKAQFILADWDHPDEYGQGIDEYVLSENSTGSWVPFDGVYYTDSHTISAQWNASNAGLKIYVSTWLNMTLTGAIDGDDGKRYHRHNISVSYLGSIIFNQQNLTYVEHGGLIGTLRNYGYEVIFNFIPQGGSIYVITITYEVFYLEN
jgi:hypothetical protein